MKPLQDVIATLRREIRAALVEESNLPPGVRLEADRVTLTLQVEILASSGTDQLTLGVLDSQRNEENSRGNAGHALTIEFNCSSSRSPSLVSQVEPARPRPIPRPPPKGLEGAAADQVSRALTEIFGAPGFDSAARATVFVEALEGLSDEQIRDVVTQLDQPMSGGVDPSAKRVRHHLKNVVRSGPLKSVPKASGLLREMFEEQDPTAVVALIKERWKSQEDWNAER